MKADKGNSLVMMHRSDNEGKVNDFLTNNDAKIDTKFSFNKFNALVRRRIEDSKYIIPSCSEFSLKVMNPRPPSLRSSKDS